MRRAVFIFVIFLFVGAGYTHSVFAAGSDDTDNDGLSDQQETQIYHTDLNNKDTDGDGYTDGDEVRFGYDPNNAHDDGKLAKLIKVSLKSQTLTYYLGDYVIDSFKVSTGKKGFRTPQGTFTIDEKRPVVTYKGSGYYYPNIKWNLHFLQGKQGGFYIHGAPWRKSFGYPGSHGCVNVSYSNIEPLYKWADVGTKVVIF